MLLEAFFLGMCINVGHCNELSNQYFYYNPVALEQIGAVSDQAEERVRNLVGEKIMNGLVPVAGLLMKREATIGFPNNKTISLKVKANEIGVNFSYNF
jgi:hypothetical protein